MNGRNPLTLHYARRLGLWKKEFEDRFTLHPFLRSGPRNGDVVEDFFSVLFGNEPFEVSGLIEGNIAVTARLLSGMRFVHQHLERQGLETRSRSALGGAIANHFIPVGEVIGEKPKLDKRTAERIIETYRDDPKNLDKSFFSRRIITQALEDSTHHNVGEPPNLDVARHLSATEIGTLENLGPEILRDFQKCPKAWAFHNCSREQKNISGAKAEEDVQAHREPIQEIDSNLPGFAAILRG